MSNVSLKGDLFKQIPLQYECCVELNLKFNLSHLSVDVKFKQTVSHFNDTQCAKIKVSELEKEIKERKWKNHSLVKHNTYSVIGYFFYYSGLIFYRSFIYGRNDAVRTGSPRDIQSSAETGGTANTGNININRSNESSAANPAAVPFNCSYQATEENTTPRRSFGP